MNAQCVRVLTRFFLQEIRRKEAWVDSPTATEVKKMYDAALPALHIPATTATGRKRRLEQLNWATFVRDRCHQHGDDEATAGLVALGDNN